MPEYSFVDDESGNYVDFVADATFETPLPPSHIAPLMQRIAEILERKAAKALSIEGISEIQLNPNSIKLSLRYAKYHTLPSPPSTDLSTDTTRFAIYLFAKIDAYHTLKETPFPPDFRVFLNFDETFRA